MKCDSLAIEITRKCNRECVHCMRGSAEDVSISTSIIDKIFEDVEDCENISLLGGEPLLEIGIIKYLVDKIINSDWTTNFIQVTTNGTIRDNSIIDIFNKFCESRDNRKVLIRISGDEFHDKVESDAAYDFYCERTTNDNVLIIYKTDIDQFKYVGRGVDYIKNNPQSSYWNVIRTLAEKHRIKVINDKVYCTLAITCNGDVTFNEELSYKELDKIKMGNILSDSLENIINTNNNNCLLTCCDYENLAMLSWINREVKQLTNENIEGIISKTIFDAIYKKRVLAKSLYPLLSAQDIIIGLMMPRDYLFEVKDEINRIYNCFRKYKNMNLFRFGLNDIVNAFLKNTKGIDVIELEKARKNYTVLAILRYADMLSENMRKDIEENSKYFRMVTRNNSTETAEFIKLRELNNSYKSKGILAKNDLVLPCNIGDSLYGEPNIYKAVQDYLEKQYKQGKLQF